MIRILFFIFIILAPLTFSQKVYNYVGRSTSKLSIPYNAQINRQGDETFYAWFNEMGFFFFTAKAGIVVTARRDFLVSSKNEALQLWATVVEEIVADGFYPIDTDIGNATFATYGGLSSVVWIEWNEDQLMWAVAARFEESEIENDENENFDSSILNNTSYSFYDNNYNGNIQFSLHSTNSSRGNYSMQVEVNNKVVNVTGSFQVDGEKIVFSPNSSSKKITWGLISKTESDGSINLKFKDYNDASNTVYLKMK